MANLAKIEAEQQTTQIELMKNSEISKAETLASDYKTKYETLLNTQDNTLLVEAQQTVSQQASQIKNLSSQLDYAAKMLETEIQTRPVIITKPVVK